MLGSITLGLNAAIEVPVEVVIGLALLAVRPVRRSVDRLRQRRAARLVRPDRMLPPAPVRKQIEARKDTDKVP